MHCLRESTSKSVGYILISNYSKKDIFGPRSCPWKSTILKIWVVVEPNYRTKFEKNRLIRYFILLKIQNIVFDRGASPWFGTSLKVIEITFLLFKIWSKSVSKKYYLTKRTKRMFLPLEFLLMRYRTGNNWNMQCHR